jgi:hypothetical protein
VIKDLDWKKFCGLIRAADEVTAGKPRSEAALGLMFKALERHDFAAVARAVAMHVDASRFAVTPADITRLIEGSPEERSQAAWRLFLRAVDRHGFYDSVRFPDPAYHYAVMQLGGWERVCEEFHGLTDKELQFRAKDWRQLYETGERVASWDGEQGKAEVPKYLEGFFERGNLEGGHSGHLPDVLDAETGEKLSREALMQPGRGKILRIADAAETVTAEALP